MKVAVIEPTHQRLRSRIMELVDAGHKLSLKFSYSQMQSKLTFDNGDEYWGFVLQENGDGYERMLGLRGDFDRVDSYSYHGNYRFEYMIKVHLIRHIAGEKDG